jgi:multicomponent Na+:H+ antiporter subunit F
MDDFFRATGIILMLQMVPVFYRMIAGPTAIDRIVATNIIGTKTAVLLVVIGTLFHSVEMFVDFALAYALLNFIGSLAAARYFARVGPEELGPEGASAGAGANTESEPQG